MPARKKHKSAEYRLVEQDIAGVVEASHPGGALVKAIIEAALLSDDEKVRACVLSKAAGADSVKTSTGFGPGGATTEDVALMRRVVGPEMGVKAAGGVRDLKSAQAMLEAGADRIGASVGVKIVQESKGSPLMDDAHKCVRMTKDGLSLRVWQASDIRNDELLMRIDILYGGKTLRPEWACRVSN